MLIGNSSVKKLNNFWNGCVFHPTDAVEDPWGKRILDRMSEDGAIRTVRIYTMFEDIVYLDEYGNLKFDFRVSDLRIDYLVDRGYDILLAYAGIPDCIALTTANKTTAAKGKTRYKGKMWNTSPPRDMKLWENICYEYTKHNVERYGIETVKKWRCQCFNEPDIATFFLSELPRDAVEARLVEYCKMYEAFQNGVRRVSEDISIGGPALAHRHPFLGGFLDYVKDNGLKLDFISVHNYGTSPKMLNDGSRPFCADSVVMKQEEYFNTVCAHGFGDTSMIVDEWGMASAGFYNHEECPELMERETELFSAYFVKLIRKLIDTGLKIEQLMICLSGQHEMTEDFSGFRNFFTLNFIAKPIYNAYILASMLGDELLETDNSNGDVYVIPTKTQKDGYAVLLSYSSDNFDKNVDEIEETIEFSESIKGRTVKIWCIDGETTNPYRLYQKMNTVTPNADELRLLRQEGKLLPTQEYVSDGENGVRLRLTANCTYLITVN